MSAYLSAAQSADTEDWWRGPLAPLRGCLQFGIPDAKENYEIIPFCDFRKFIPTFISAAKQFYDSDDERALLSQWSKAYLRVVIAAGAVAALCSRRPLNLSLPGCALRTCMAIPESIWLPHIALGERSDTPAILYRSLCIDHLKSTLEVLARSVRLSPRVLWSNAGNIFDLLFDMAEENPELAATARYDRVWLLNSQEFFDTGLRNPLHESVCYIMPRSSLLPRPMRTRRQCCLRNFIDGEVLCAACPHLHELSDDMLRVELKKRNSDSPAD